MSRSSKPEPALLNALLAQGGGQVARQALIEAAGISATAARSIFARHRASGALIGGVGARFGPGIGTAIGVSLTMTRVRAGLVDANGELLCAVEAPESRGQLALPPDELLGRIRSTLVDLLGEAIDQAREWSARGAPVLPLLGLIVAWPVPLTVTGHASGTSLRDRAWHEAGELAEVPTLKQRVGAALGAPFEGERVGAINLANAQGLAVAFDRARATGEQDDDTRRTGMVVRVGTGIGAATFQLNRHSPARSAFLDTRLVAGAHNIAGELAHLPLARSVIEDLNEANPHRGDLADIDYEGWRCECGRPYHLGAFASGQALVRRLAASGYIDEAVEPNEVYDDLRDTHSEAKRYAAEDLGRLIGHALAGPVLMLDPDRITLTGPLSGPELNRGVLAERGVWAHAIGDHVDVEWVPGPEARFLAVRGAALAMLRRRVYRRLDEGVEAVRSDVLPFGPADLEALAAR
ncbi:MAG: ROK family protein [Thermoleophilia bacterium]